MNKLRPLEEIEADYERGVCRQDDIFGEGARALDRIHADIPALLAAARERDALKVETVWLRAQSQSFSGMVRRLLLGRRDDHELIAEAERLLKGDDL